jgi:hypothetical protein
LYSFAHPIADAPILIDDQSVSRCDPSPSGKQAIGTLSRVVVVKNAGLRVEQM